MPAIGSPSEPATLLVVAHGTASDVGLATTRRLVEAVALNRPNVRVHLGFLDVAAPALPEALDTATRPTIVVPLLLSTGFHVTVDIPAIVVGQPDVHVARHLGPHPLLADAMAARLSDAGADGADWTTFLVAAGSTQPAAADEAATAAALLADRLGGPVSVLTMTDDLETVLASSAPRTRVAPYLLAEGQFVDRLRAAGNAHAIVSAPLGAHPAVVDLVWMRYDEVATAAAASS